MVGIALPPSYKRMELLKKVHDDYPALLQWLKQNEKLGTEDFIPVLERMAA